MLGNLEMSLQHSDNPISNTTEDLFPNGSAECDFDEFIKIIENILNDPE